MKLLTKYQREFMNEISVRELSPEEMQIVFAELLDILGYTIAAGVYPLDSERTVELCSKEDFE